MLKYLYWLQRAELLLLLTSDIYGISKMNKQWKVYLNNSNLIYALSGDSANIGTVRETFFFNQLNVGHKVTSPSEAYFLIDD